MASLADEKGMKNAYEIGRDLYSTMASDVYKVAYEDCKEFFPDGTTNTEGKKRRGNVKRNSIRIIIRKRYSKYCRRIENEY